jgi:serine/threonine protein kinase
MDADHTPSDTDTLVNGVYCLQQELGQGSYGKVYQASGMPHHTPVAIKMHSNNQLLNREVQIYKYVWDYKTRGKGLALNIPRMLWEGQHGCMRAMVMSRLGPSLDKLFDRYSKKWSTPTIHRVAADCLMLLREIHSLGLVHRDIKPDNFAVDHEDATRIYIFDFGLSSQYISPSGKHVSPRTGLSLIGTMRYASIHTHDGQLQSRRDDLESLFYMLLYFTTGTLPWKHMTEEVYPERKARSDAVLRAKHSLTQSQIPDDLYPFFQAVRELQYADLFDYDTWVAYFEKEAHTRDQTDWHLPSKSGLPRRQHTLRNYAATPRSQSPKLSSLA